MQLVPKIIFHLLKSTNDESYKLQSSNMMGLKDQPIQTEFIYEFLLYSESL